MSKHQGDIERRWIISKWPDGQGFVSGPETGPEEVGLRGMDWVEAARVEVMPVSDHLERVEGAFKEAERYRHLHLIDAELAHREKRRADAFTSLLDEAEAEFAVFAGAAEKRGEREVADAYRRAASNLQQRRAELEGGGADG